MQITARQDNDTADDKMQNMEKEIKVRELELRVRRNVMKDLEVRHAETANALKESKLRHTKTANRLKDTEELLHYWHMIAHGVVSNATEAEQKLKDTKTELERSNDLIRELDAIQMECNRCYDALKQAHAILLQDHNRLKQVHEELKQAHNELKEARERTKDELKEKTRSYDELKAAHNTLKQNIDVCRSEDSTQWWHG
jgi:chromosome segregation ATPase